MKGAIYQFKPELGEVERNIAKMAEAIKGIDADFVVLPELATSGYFFLSMDEVKPFSLEPEDEKLAPLYEISASKDMMIVLGYAEKSGNVVYNSALAILPDGKNFTYRKTHLFYKEKDAFKPGDTGFFVFEFRGVKFGMMICYDWFYPESARILAKNGAQVLLHVSNLVLPGLGQKGMVVRSIENSVFSFTANRIGVEEKAGISLRFTGMSQIVNPRGEILSKASEDDEEVIVAEFDPSEALDKQITELNHVFKDRRPEFYADLCD